MGSSNDHAESDLPKKLGGKAMPSSGSPTVRRRRAGKILRALREQSGKDANDAADALEVTSSTIYRMELGRVGIKPRDVQALVEVYGVDDADLIEELVRLARDGRKRGWWARYSDTISPPYATYIGLEQDASSLSLYDGLIINGLLQTREYAKHTFDYQLGQSRRYMAERIDLRMERQQRLRSDLKIWNVIDEAAIRRVLGGPKVMIDQLRNLLELGSLPNVHLQVLPFDGGAYPGMLSSFTILGFGELDGDVDPGYRHPDVVYIEGHNGDVYEEGEDVQPFHEIFGNLRSAALDPGRSLEFIEQQAERLKAL
ncbi:helix-turn-helix domain-containing protein [Glycomyces sp. TRM65418]|uniref:helix-turn-helix domain-containing protein n=1 Tax=Glycomyces sp. TRM65418 TaxID=2867006 RepID=UPI001CE68CDC|nr:helix-turn-helix transcriptional regulator [Glycomyces sp. TRM65418]MCC3765574.1 helix-turn-helix domain-containing protein [Glycomyces sp. TRM65418]QZD55176.1 helix-turn-helix domain-containing protein [Glycomyces sp. TRM65418]